MSKNKLEIPAPGSPTGDSLFIAYVASALVLVALGYFFSGMEDPVLAEKEKLAEVTPKERDPKLESLVGERAHAATFKSMSDEELKKREWTDADRRAVYRFGPRNASEALCELEADRLVSGKLSAAMRLEMEKTLDRRTEFAPWSCLLRLHFDQKIADDDIREEVESFVQELETFKGNERLPISVVDTYRETRNRPKSERFYRWLRRCALHNNYQPHTACRKILKQISPAQGRDMMEMYDLHLQKEGSEKDVVMSIETIGRMIRNGQPLNWNVKETKELPDYNADLKIAGVLALCRYTLSDDPALSFPAMNQLAKSGEINLRGNDKNTQTRWWITCSILFGGDDQGQTMTPMMFVKKTADDEPRFDLKFLREENLCDVKDGYPNWYCASEKWTSKSNTVGEAISDAFVRTAWVEFAEDSPL